MLSKWICFWVMNISGLIFIKLFRIRKGTNIINTMFLVHLFITSVLVPLRIFSFFHIGYSHFADMSHPEQDIQVCNFYIVTSAINLMFSIYINIGMMFCRLIYVRYAEGLLSMGSNLFHCLVFLVTVTFFTHWLLMFPIRLSFRPNLFILKDADLNTIQKRVCTKTTIPWFDDIEENKNVSLQPKLIILSFSTLFLFITWFLYSSAQKQTNRHRIPKTRKNLMTMKHQSRYLTILILILFFTLFFSTSAHRQTKRYRIPKTITNLMAIKHQSQYLTILILVLVSDQVLFIILQIFYDQLGVDNVFIIWWIFHFLEIVFIHII